MKKVLFMMLVLCAAGMVMAQQDTVKAMDKHMDRKVSYHAIINAGVGCYYKNNSNSNLKGPDATDGIYGITVINGAQISPRLYIGVGLGFESLMVSRGDDSSHNPMVDYQPDRNFYYGFPVFATSRWYLKKMKKVSPYILVDMGYEAWRNDPKGELKYRPDRLWQNCFYFNGGFGIRFGRYADIYCTAGLRDVQLRAGIEL